MNYETCNNVKQHWKIDGDGVADGAPAVRC